MDPKKRQELKNLLASAVAISDRVRPQLLRDPNVVAVGAGIRRQRGKATGEAAVVVTVLKKLGQSELAKYGSQLLPETIEGVPVDVVEFAKPVEDDATRRAIDQALAVKAGIEREWLSVPNVTGIAVGYKERGGCQTEEIAITVFVQRKLPAALVTKSGSRLVPSSVSGIPTDVIELGRMTSHVIGSGIRADRQDPLVGGVSVGIVSRPFRYGTLAAIAFDNTNAPVALSNEHVLDGGLGEDVVQPMPVMPDDSLSVALQLNVCLPAAFLRIDTPNTLGGTVLANAALAAAIAAALSDDIDPTRDGQESTNPPAGALTTEEYTRVQCDYKQFPLPGKPYAVDAKWEYERRTDAGVFAHTKSNERTNPHILRYHRLFLDAVTYQPTTNIRMFGAVLPPVEGVSCNTYNCTAFLRREDQAFSHPVVLRSIGTDAEKRQEFSNLLGKAQLDPVEEELFATQQSALCLYYGEFSASALTLGHWRHWMHVQTVNTTPEGTDPLIAAKTIGGIAVSDHFANTLDIACGPFVFEDDGGFDIDPIIIA